MSASDGRIEAAISRTLRTGVLVSVVLLVAGLALGIADGTLRDDSPDGAAVVLITLGLVALVITPMVRVLASTVIYWRSRDRVYLTFTLAVIALLALSVLLGATA